MNGLETLKIELKDRCPALELREEEPMSKHTSFRIGGPVKLMALPKTDAEVVQTVQSAKALGIEPIFIGNGSNLLVADRGVDGFIVKAGEGLGSLEQTGENAVCLGAGTLLSRAACFARDRGLTGLEFAHGIPGSIGGAVTMNAGAYGGEMADVVERVTCVRPDGGLEVYSGENLAFGYRKSVFEGGKAFILSVTVRLSPGDKESIAQRINELSRRRREKQPLEYPSAGSTFKRPAGGYAAALIDSCGLKGYRVGGAQVSEKHAGFIVNLGGASCDDVMRVMSHVYETVLGATGIRLEPEVKLLGV